MINYKTHGLNGAGKEFAEKLGDILPEMNIDYICSSDEERCVETVSHLAKRYNLKIQEFNKDDFDLKIPLKKAVQYNCAVICYRIENINGILSELGLPEFRNNNRNGSYEFIYHLQIKDKKVIIEQNISTSYKRL